MAISLPDARQLSDEVLEALRLRALRGCQLGFSETELADLLGVCRETVCHWWTAYIEARISYPRRRRKRRSPLLKRLKAMEMVPPARHPTRRPRRWPAR
jgi:hypothetical protein